jgi:NAD(P)-dependent dehydrogenase (short-subunit alcohol dehydrogenase family)
MPPPRDHAPHIPVYDFRALGRLPVLRRTSVFAGESPHENPVYRARAASANGIFLIVPMIDVVEDLRYTRPHHSSSMSPVFGVWPAGVGRFQKACRTARHPRRLNRRDRDTRYLFDASSMKDGTVDLLDLSACSVLITGGCGAIGRVIVRTLADHGARVAVNDILPEDEALRILVEAGIENGKVRYFQADVRQLQQVESLLQTVESVIGMPNVVCLHAGMAEAYPIDQYPVAAFDAILDLNLRAAFLAAQAATRRWIALDMQGHLIFTTSWVQDVPWPEITPYTVSKAGMKALMRGFARELAPKGIRANAVAPGIVGVGMARRQWDSDPSYRARAQKAIPLGDLQTPESVAHAFLFLCSRLAAYMTGSVLLVDGGCSLYPMDE